MTPAVKILIKLVEDCNHSTKRHKDHTRRELSLIYRTEIIIAGRTSDKNAEYRK